MSDERNVLVAGGGGALGSQISLALEAAGAKPFAIGRNTFDLRNEAEAVMSMLLIRPSIVVNAMCDLSDPAKAFRWTMSAGMNLIHAAAAQNAKFIHLTQADQSGLYPWEDLPTLVAHLGAQEGLGIMCKTYADRHNLRCMEVRLPRLYGFGSKRMDPVSTAAALASRGVKENLKSVKVPFHKGDVFELMHTSDAAAAIVKEVVSGTEGLVRVNHNRKVSAVHLMEVALAVTNFSGDVQFTGKEVSGKYRSPYPGGDGVSISINSEISMEESVGSAIAELLHKSIKGADPAGKAAPLKAAPAAAGREA